jgi:hypothetical protein
MYTSANDVFDAVRAYLNEGWNALSSEERATLLRFKQGLPDYADDLINFDLDDLDTPEINWEYWTGLPKEDE